MENYQKKIKIKGRERKGKRKLKRGKGNLGKEMGKGVAVVR